MSAYSTLRITRGKALNLILEKLATATPELLEDLLRPVLEERLYNARVVPDGTENDEDRL